MEDPADDKTLNERLMTWLVIFDIVSYSGLLIFDGYMVVKYLIKQKKYDIAYLTSFYSLTAVLAISKILMLTAFLRLAEDKVYLDYMYDISN